MPSSIADWLPLHYRLDQSRYSPRCGRVVPITCAGLRLGSLYPDAAGRLRDAPRFGHIVVTPTATWRIGDNAAHLIRRHASTGGTT